VAGGAQYWDRKPWCTRQSGWPSSSSSGPARGFLNPVRSLPISFRLSERVVSPPTSVPRKMTVQRLFFAEKVSMASVPSWLGLGLGC
jgi:hypothetical protein